MKILHAKQVNSVVGVCVLNWLKLLLRRPDVLLLDEPTNHLDIEINTMVESF